MCVNRTTRITITPLVTTLTITLSVEFAASLSSAGGCVRQLATLGQGFLHEVRPEGL
jgi:hypothetical protein